MTRKERNTNDELRIIGTCAVTVGLCLFVFAAPIYALGMIVFGCLVISRTFRKEKPE